MEYKKYFLIFIFSFAICILVYLSINLRADYKMMIGISLMIAVIISLLILNFEKPEKMVS